VTTPAPALALCRKCGETKPRSEFYTKPFKRRCRVCIRQETQDWRDRNREAVRSMSRANRLKTMYGITVMEWAALVLASGGFCALCGREEPLSVDHDHETGAIRGMLCRTCNTGLGCFRDDTALLDEAKKYLGTSHSLPR
jgi:hypothetical protein